MGEKGGEISDEREEIKSSVAATIRQNQLMGNQQQHQLFDFGKQEQVEEEKDDIIMKRVIKRRDLGDGSSVVYYPCFIPHKNSWDFFHFLNHHIPWSTPTIHVFGKPFLQPRDSCYVASEGLKELSYSGHKPHAYHWDDFPHLKQILDQVHQALPGSHFNSLLLNRYNTGNHYVSWHADNETLYGPTPEIASVSFGCERDFLLKKRNTNNNKPPTKRPKYNNDTDCTDKCCFTLKHGSLLVMRGNTQRDWLHSVPKRGRETKMYQCVICVETTDCKCFKCHFPRSLTFRVSFVALDDVV